jgi:hypothetical protein
MKVTRSPNMGRIRSLHEAMLPLDPDKVELAASRTNVFMRGVDMALAFNMHAAIAEHIHPAFFPTRTF